MGNRAADLRWDDEDDENDDATAPSGLTRSAIVTAAIALADAEGLPAVSIRRIAAELGARPMSLYTHIAAKDDLIDLMVNQAAAGVVVEEPLPEGWRAAITAISLASYEAFAAHPWIIKAIGTTGRRTPNADRHVEQTAAALAELQLDEATANTLVGIVDDYVLGHVVRMRVREVTGGSFPELPDAFELGLAAVLDGIEQRLLR